MEPASSRPFMPGYGILPANEGSGLLPWEWAVERLERSHDYWLSTVRPDARPHAMPVWGVWMDQSLWFSSGGMSRKTRNLAANPWAVITTDNALEPVVVEGEALLVSPKDERSQVARFADAVNSKYRRGLRRRVLLGQRLLSNRTFTCLRPSRERLHGFAHEMDIRMS